MMPDLILPAGSEWAELARTCSCHRRLYRVIGGKVETKKVANA